MGILFIGLQDYTVFLKIALSGNKSFKCFV